MLDMPLLDPIPSPVEHADFAALEWEPLLALVAGFAASPVGRVRDPRPATLHRRRLDQQPASAHRGDPPGAGGAGLHPLGGLFDPTQLAAKAQIPGAALEANELQAIAGWPTT